MCVRVCYAFAYCVATKTIFIWQSVNDFLVIRTLETQIRVRLLFIHTSCYFFAFVSPEVSGIYFLLASHNAINVRLSSIKVSKSDYGDKFDKRLNLATWNGPGILCFLRKCVHFNFQLRISTILKTEFSKRSNWITKWFFLYHENEISTILIFQDWKFMCKGS